MKKAIFFLCAMCAGFVFGQNSPGLPNGNLGIGTGAPYCNLQVSTTGALPIRISRGGTGNQVNNLDIYFTSNPTNGPAVSPGSAIIQSTSTSGDMVFLPGLSSTSNGMNMILTKNGFLNLSDIPLSALPGRLNVSLNNSGSTAPCGIFSKVTATDDWQYNLKLEVNRDKAKAIGVQNSNLNDGTFTVLGDGTTWIGTEVPTGSFSGALLSVSGMMVAKEIFVQTSNWADYVFSPSYKLASLKDVEHFISENGHLPNVPTATEIKDNGYNIAETDRILLEKIEELTLYVIELKKGQEKLENENILLKAELGK